MSENSEKKEIKNLKNLKDFLFYWKHSMFFQVLTPLDWIFLIISIIFLFLTSFISGFVIGQFLETARISFIEFLKNFDYIKLFVASIFLNRTNLFDFLFGMVTTLSLVYAILRPIIKKLNKKYKLKDSIIFNLKQEIEGNFKLLAAVYIVPRLEINNYKKLKKELYFLGPPNTDVMNIITVLYKYIFEPFNYMVDRRVPVKEFREERLRLLLLILEVIEALNVQIGEGRKTEDLNGIIQDFQDKIKDERYVIADDDLNLVSGVILNEDNKKIWNHKLYVLINNLYQRDYKFTFKIED